jgi:phosphoglycolate phosphatase
MTARPVGFDLDMTLIDSRRGILASFAAFAAETGVPVDLDAVDRRLGIKLEDELAYWLPAGQIEEGIRVYRKHYVRLAVDLTTILPGARESLAAVRATGARVLVITAKIESSAWLSLDGVGLRPDSLFGDVHGLEKAAVLSAEGASVYVGDTPADMTAALAAGAHSVGVTTGSFTGEELRAAGAATVLDSLTGFPDVYRTLQRQKPITLSGDDD